MRKKPTPSEALLWRHLCGKQLGVRVRRQHVLFPYVADFYVPAYRLVVEVDLLRDVRAANVGGKAAVAKEGGTSTYAAKRHTNTCLGGVHRTAEARARDARRTRELVAMYGVRVLRIEAELVEADVYAAVALVRAGIR